MIFAGGILNMGQLNVNDKPHRPVKLILAERRLRTAKECYEKNKQNVKLKNLNA